MRTRPVDTQKMYVSKFALIDSDRCKFCISHPLSRVSICTGWRRKSENLDPRLCLGRVVGPHPPCILLFSMSTARTTDRVLDKTDKTFRQIRKFRSRTCPSSCTRTCGASSWPSSRTRRACQPFHLPDLHWLLNFARLGPTAKFHRS